MGLGTAEGHPQKGSVCQAFLRKTINSKEAKGCAEHSHMCTVPHHTGSGNLTGKLMVAGWNV